MFKRTINADKVLFKTSPVRGEKITLGKREFQVRRVGRIHYQLIETFFA